MAHNEQPLRVILAKPRGFCAGVERAIEIVERALDIQGTPVYVRHEIVHNKYVVERLRERGAVFVEDLEDIPKGAVTIFSAHGVTQAVERHARTRFLDVIDATCPLVRKVHNEGRRYAERDYDIILIGHAGHPEVEGTRGQIAGHIHVLATVEEVDDLAVRDPAKVAYITQTTLSMFDTRAVIAALKRRYPRIVGPDMRDICYATQNRQSALLALTKRVEVVLVVGAANSSNSNRLREIGEDAGIPTYLIESPSQISEAWIADVGVVGITAAASAPEVLVQQAIETLAVYRPVAVETLDGVEETVRFRLPQRLLDAPAASASAEH